MPTSNACFKKYGDPRLIATQNKTMTLWVVEENFLKAFAHVRFAALGTIGFPKKIFINKDFQPKLKKALQNVIDRGLAKELVTWDGVFVIRKKVSNNSLSLHSWAIACDLNRATNEYGAKPQLSAAFVKCFTDEGLEWGGDWRIPDGMHFQLKSLK